MRNPPDDLPAPNLVLWPAGKAIHRVHHSAYGATEFNPGNGEGRFHPIRTSDGQPIPTIYGSSTVDGALSETLFHNLPPSRKTKLILRSKLIPLLICTLACRRDLALVELKGFGLRKLGVMRRQLIDTHAEQYERTRRWAEALYAREPAADGLVWMSRQHDSSEAVVLFGSRVARAELAVIESPRGLVPPSAGWDEVTRAADAAGVTIEIPDE
ncbi:MAG TPA: RES family NAD+ phosphorylase [Thermoanaerobaculia bacterium]|nr:RES family NAD+ phosphorylase [Thermoanaerobaculia bacterium]